MRRRFLVPVLGAALASWTLLAGSPPASADGVTVVGTPDPVAADGTVHISGSGCPAGGTVGLTVWPTGGGAPAIYTTVVADAGGGFAGSVPLAGAFGPGEQLGVGAACGAWSDPAAPRGYDYIFVAAPEVAAQLEVSPLESTYGDEVEAVMTVTPDSVDGTVTFYVDGEQAGAGLVHQGVVRLPVPGPLAPGLREVRAVLDPFAEGSPTVEDTVEIVVRRAVPAVRLRLPDATVSARERARVRAKVVSEVVTHPTGPLVVRDGRQVILRSALQVGDGGVRTLRLPRLEPGSHDLTVTYGGSDLLERGRSAARTLLVTRR